MASTSTPASEQGTTPLSGGIQSRPVDFSQPIPYGRLQGKVVLVTGGASGIGAALSSALARYGASVIVADIDVARGEVVVTGLRRAHATTMMIATTTPPVPEAVHHFVRVDVADWNSQVALFRTAAALSPTRGIDAVVAVAGISDSAESEALEQLTGTRTSLFSPSSSTEPLPPAPQLRTLHVDLVGTMYTAHLALAYLGAGNAGSEPCSLSPSAPDSSVAANDRDRHLLLVSSIAGFSPLAGASVYAAAKHGVVGLFRSLRLSAPVVHGVRVNLLAPQYVPTPIHGVRGAALLLGVPKTAMDDVVEAAVRLVADKGIIGRGLLVGTRATGDLVERAGLLEDEDASETKEKTLDEKGAVWDVYAHDFDASDLLMRRAVALLNLATKVRTTGDIWRDVVRLLVAIGAALWNAGRSVLGGRRRPSERMKSR